MGVFFSNSTVVATMQSPNILLQNYGVLAVNYLNVMYILLPSQVFDLQQCYEEMQKQAAEACAAVAAQTAAVRGSGIPGQNVVSCPDPTHKRRGSGYTSPISWASGSAEAL